MSVRRIREGRTDLPKQRSVARVRCHPAATITGTVSWIMAVICGLIGIRLGMGSSPLGLPGELVGLIVGSAAGLIAGPFVLLLGIYLWVLLIEWRKGPPPGQ
jgi:hypothetical protein